MTDMKRPFAKPEGRKRDWFKGTAADKAVVSLWSTADQLEVNEGRYLKMLLLTGKRRTSLASMRWEHINDDWFWDAPDSESKNKRRHSIPLPKKAQEILHPRKNTGPVFGTISFQKLVRQIRQTSDIKDFIYHGARHLMESKLAELRIPPHIRDRLFDHAPNRGAGAGYDHYEYRDEMLAALNQWAAHIDKLRTPAKGVAVLR